MLASDLLDRLVGGRVVHDRAAVFDRDIFTKPHSVSTTFGPTHI